MMMMMECFSPHSMKLSGPSSNRILERAVSRDWQAFITPPRNLSITAHLMWSSYSTSYFWTYCPPGATRLTVFQYLVVCPLLTWSLAISWPVARDVYKHKSGPVQSNLSLACWRDSRELDTVCLLSSCHGWYCANYIHLMDLYYVAHKTGCK